MGFLDRVGRFLDDVLLLPDDLRADLEAAEAALQAELFPEAEDLFAGVLAERPTLTRAALGLARARTARGDREGTLAALSSARRTAPEDGDVALWCARLALEEGQLAEARGAARTAARALAERGGAELAEAAALLAEVERRDGRPDRALKELRKAVASDPSDPRWALALLDWHAEAGEAGGAAAAAVPLRGPAAEDAALARRVGQALGRAGALDAAEPFLEAARDGGEAAAQVDLARLAWLRRDLEAAEALAREAVARGAGAEALELLGLVLTQSGAFQEASEALAAAAALTRDVRLWRYAARIVPLDDPNHLEAVLTGLEAAEPGDAVGQAVRVLVAAEAGASLEGKVAEGAGDDSSSDEAEEEPRALLAQARRALGAGDALGALGALDAWDRRCAGQSWAEADRERADAIRREALRRRWHGPDGVVDLGAAIDAVARFAAAHDLPEVLRETERLRDDLDRPLLLGVLGEFNAGKSTLINAFIGAEVAPMGIVPTTATLNVLRDGAERLVRVVRSDGSTREGGYDALRRLLAEAEAEAEGPEVDRVEIVLPSATLERVWVLDAPGTNALDPAHERLAREAARRADAVLWVFDAAQAGKLTESAMHERLRAQGRLV
ncbi:MAG: dynamin family protein, partial [Myxococcota bacterium]